MVAAGLISRLLSSANRWENSARRNARRLLGRERWPHQEPAELLEGNRFNGVAAHDLLYLPALPMDFRWQRPQQLASALAASTTRVTYAEVFDRSFFQPVLRDQWFGERLRRLRIRVPGRPNVFSTGLNDAQARDIYGTIGNSGSDRPDAVLVQHPFWAPVCRHLVSTGVTIMYDRIDMHSGFEHVSPHIEADETELISMASAVFFSASLLRPDNSCLQNLIHLPNAVEASRFTVSAPPQRPVVGYVGAIDYWFDIELLEYLSRQRPEWHFRIAGMCGRRDYKERLRSLSNVDYVGEIPYSQVVRFLARCSLLLIPFRRGDLVDRVDPVKMYESWAAGLPVVIPEIPSVAEWQRPMLYRYQTPGSAEQRIAEALAEDSAEFRNQRAAVAANHTWNSRAQIVESVLVRLCSGSNFLDVRDENY